MKSYFSKIFFLTLLYSLSVTGQNLQDEACDQINQMIQNRFLQDNENYYTVFEIGPRYFKILEGTKLKYEILPDSLTSADILNGYTWKSKVIFSFIANRIIQSNQYGLMQESTWDEWDSEKGIPLYLVKKKNTWRFIGLEDHYKNNLIGDSKPSLKDVKDVLLRPMLDNKYRY